MLNRFFRGAANRLILPPVRALVAAGVSPNALTIAGLLVVIAASWLIAGGRLFAGGVVLAIGGLFDMADGAVAKVGGKTSTAGAFLDSTVDRLSDAVLFFAIFWQYLGREDRAGAMLSLAALVLGLVVSYIKARAEGLGLDCNVGVAERPERVVLPAFGLLFDQLIPALLVLVALSLVTAVQRFAYVWKQAVTSGTASER